MNECIIVVISDEFGILPSSLHTMHPITVSAEAFDVLVDAKFSPIDNMFDFGTLRVAEA